MTIHTTTVTAINGFYFSDCTCGDRGWAYRTEAEAAKDAERHRESHYCYEAAAPGATCQHGNRGAHTMAGCAR